MSKVTLEVSIHFFICLQEFMLSLYYMITPGISRRRRSGSFHTSSTTFLSQDTVAERTFTAIHGVPRIMHMGDYWITLHSVSNNLPISVYQAFPAPLLARAFHVQRTLSGLGPISSPPFLCHPIVTADLLGMLHLGLNVHVYLLRTILYAASLHAALGGSNLMPGSQDSASSRINTFDVCRCTKGTVRPPQ